MKFEKIDVTKANVNPFQRIGQDWMLISAKKEGKGICGCRRYLYTDIF